MRFAASFRLEKVIFNKGHIFVRKAFDGLVNLFTNIYIVHPV